MSSILGNEVVWRVVPLAPPRLDLHCSRCERNRPFACADEFRLNAQQRRLDVWLLYRCAHCGTTWKRRIFRRCTPEEIGLDLYDRLLRNDRATAWQYAFLPDGRGAEPFEGEVRIERSAAASPVAHRIRIAVPFPCAVRLDRLLAAELGVSRPTLYRWSERGDLVIEPLGPRALRRPVRDGSLLTLAGEACSLRTSARA